MRAFALFCCRSAKCIFLNIAPFLAFGQQPLSAHRGPYPHRESRHPWSRWGLLGQALSKLSPKSHRKNLSTRRIPPAVRCV